MPGLEQVRPGLWSLPIPFPGNLLRYTLSYLLVTEGRVVVIDPGFDDDGNWALRSERSNPSVAASRM